MSPKIMAQKLLRDYPNRNESAIFARRQMESCPKNSESRKRWAEVIGWIQKLKPAREMLG
jgi:hypothetical protein